MLNRICVAFDDSAPAGAALAVAVEFARRADAGLTLVHVADPPVEEPVAPDEGIGFDLLGFTDERRWQARLAAVAAELTADLGGEHAAPVEAQTVAGEPALELPALAASTGAALFAAGAPRTGLRALLHRSIARSLMGDADRPVLLASGGELRADGAVLVCVRGSRWADRRAIRAGGRLAAALRAEVVCREAPPSADAAGWFLERCHREQPLAAIIGEEEAPGWRSRRHHPERVLPGRAPCPVVVVGRTADGPLLADDLAGVPPAGAPSWASC